MNINHLRDVDLNLLLILMVVLEERNVTRAAERLGKTQSAVSHALSRLRALLGDELLVRSGGQMAPTPQAEALLPEVRQILDAVDMLLMPAGELDPSRLSRTFQIASTDMAMLTVLPGLMRALEAEAPGVVVQARGTEGRIEERIQGGEFDMAWMVVFEDVAGIISQRIYEDHFVCVCAPDSPLIGPGGAIALDRYLEARHILVSPRGRAGGFVEDALAARGQRREVVSLTSSFAAAPLLAAQTGCVVTMPSRPALALRRAGVALHLCEPPLSLPTINVSMVYHERFKRDAAHRWLRESIMRAAATDAAASAEVG